MTEAEIIKILECCSKKVSESCAECPLRETNCLDISIEQLALDLLNRKNDSIEMYRRNIALLDEQILAKDKEIEELQHEKTELQHEVVSCRAEAIKEFWERVKEQKHECGCNFRKKPVYAVTVDKINQIAKEMGVE